MGDVQLHLTSSVLELHPNPTPTLDPLAMAAKKGLLERLAQGPVIGDGGFVFALEKRGYVKAGPWTPESAVEDPGDVLSRQLGGDQGRCHPCPAGGGYQERADCRGAENPDGEVENVNFRTLFELLFSRKTKLLQHCQCILMF